MIKKMAIAGLCMALGSLTYASDNKTFLGLEIGSATVQADTGGLFGEPDYKGTDIEYGFRIGAQNEEWRSMLVFDYYDNTDDDQNIEKGLIELDYFFMGRDPSVKSTFNPYFGVNLGYMNYESTGIDESGFLYGGQVGFTLEVADTIDLDVMYRYSLTDAAGTDHIESFVFGINYIIR